MATVDFNQLQTMLAEATTNETKLNDLRKAFARLEVVVSDINHILSEEYTPTKKERKSRAPKALGTEAKPTSEGKKRAGRPKKQAEHAAE
jgi:hypothetical protein